MEQVFGNVKISDLFPPIMLWLSTLRSSKQQHCLVWKLLLNKEVFKN